MYKIGRKYLPRFSLSFRRPIRQDDKSWPKKGTLMRASLLLKVVAQTYHPSKGHKLIKPYGANKTCKSNRKR